MCPLMFIRKFAKLRNCFFGTLFAPLCCSHSPKCFLSASTLSSFISYPYLHVYVKFNRSKRIDLCIMVSQLQTINYRVHYTHVHTVLWKTTFSPFIMKIYQITTIESQTLFLLYLLCDSVQVTMKLGSGKIVVLWSAMFILEYIIFRLKNLVLFR